MAELFTLIRVVDTETTGIDDPAEMVEIGWTDVRLFPDGWQIESGPHSSLVKPGMPISYPAMATHHIRQAEADAGIDPADARALVAAGADILCAHNVSFDGRFIHGHRCPWICTLKVARAAWPELQGHGNGSIRYERGLCLDDTRAEPAHRAGPDTWVTAHILLDLLKVYQPETMIEISKQPSVLMKISFGEHQGKRFSEVPTGYLDWIVNKSNMPSDPKREDEVHTARLELRRRLDDNASACAPNFQQQKTSETDPDAWRSQMADVRF